MRRPGGTPAHRAVPAVNLLSPWSFEALATRKLRQRFVAAGAVVVLLVAAGWAVQHLRVTQAQQVLSIEQAETARLTSETQALAPVRAYVLGVEHQKQLVQETMANEVYFSRVLDGLRSAAPPGADVETASMTLAPPSASPAAPAGDAVNETESGATDSSDPTAQTAPVPAVSPCPGPDPFNTRVVVGCITLSGSADSRATVGDFVVRLGDSDLFVEPFISTTTTADGKQVMFTGSVGLSKKVFSKRYADIEQLLEQDGLR
jgi:hypothetical protein